MSAEDITIHVFDTPSGAEEAHFHPPSAYSAALSGTYEPWRTSPIVAAGFAGASQDGRRLALTVGSVTWEVLDACTGQMVSSAKTAAAAGWTAAMDADLRHVYRVLTGTAAAAGPRAAQIVALDLTSGQQAGPIELPDVLAGFWNDPVRKGAGGEPLMHQLVPGVAPSPDGRVLAFAHADTHAVTLFDTQRLQTLRTLSLHSRPDILSPSGSRRPSNGAPQNLEVPLTICSGSAACGRLRTFRCVAQYTDSNPCTVRQGQSSASRPSSPMTISRWQQGNAPEQSLPVIVAYEAPTDPRGISYSFQPAQLIRARDLFPGVRITVPR